MRRLHTQAKLALPEGGTRTASAGRRADAAGALRDRAAALAGVAAMPGALVAALREIRSAPPGTQVVRREGWMMCGARTRVKGSGSLTPDCRCDGVRSRAGGPPSGRWRGGSGGGVRRPRERGPRVLSGG